MVDKPNSIEEVIDEFSESDSVEESQQIAPPEGEMYLCFTIPSGDEFALPATSIREVMQQDVERITPIPNASRLLLGTINLRGEIIWVADLGQFLGYPQTLNTEKSEIPVIAIEEQEMILGLAVDQLGAIQWLNIDDLKIAQNLPDHIASFVQGEWVREENSSVKLLDQIAILGSARWVA